MPEKGLPRTPLQVVLKRLEITNGVVAFEDRALSFWCTAEGMQLSWEGDDAGNGSAKK